MAVTFVAASTMGTVSANPPTLNLTLPALAADDVIIIHVLSKNIVEASNEIATPTTASGTFAEFGTKHEIDGAAAADDLRSALYWKTAVSANSGATVTCTRAGVDTALLAAVATVWRGADVDAATPFDATAPASGGSATIGDDIDFAAFDPTAAAVHVVYQGWKADDTTDPLADFTNDSTTFTIRDDQESTTGTDCTFGCWSADRGGGALGAVAVAVVGTDGSNISDVFALIPSAFAEYLAPISTQGAGGIMIGRRYV